MGRVAGRVVLDRRRPLVALMALAALGVLALLPTLGAGFEADDRLDAIANRAARPDTFFAALGTTNRPLVKATYALQRYLGGDHPRPFHAVNLALHLACGGGLFFLLRRLVSRPGAAPADLAAWVAAALWMVHPAAVEAVAPVVGRSVLLSTLALLGAFLTTTGRQPPAAGKAWAAGALAAAAGLARETALVLPALTLLWQATLGAGESPRAARRRQLPILAGTLLAALSIAASSRHRELLAFSLETRPPLEALRGNGPAILRLLGLWFAPAGLSVDPVQPPDLPWSSPVVWLSAAGVLAAAAVALVLRRRAPRAALALAWTLLSLLPSNSIVWRLDPVAPRALYLASAGLVMFVALAIARWQELASAVRARRAPRAALAGVGALIIAVTLTPTALAARERASLWASPLRLWADAALKAPDKARAWLGLGVELMVNDRLDDARLALERARALDPAEPRIHCALDALRLRRAQVALAERRSGP